MIFTEPPGLDAGGRAAWATLRGPPISHRGLWSAVIPENSLTAFEAACAAGYAIELDVRLSADGAPMVFHDAGLERMTGETGPLTARTAAELGALRLAGSDDPIPTLVEALAAVAGRSLVLVELKPEPGGLGELEAAVADQLDECKGPVAVIGFDPRTTAWFAERRPGTLRGLNADAGPKALAYALAHFTLPSLMRLADPVVQRLRVQGRPAVVWTVRREAEAAAVSALGDNLIFEGFRP